MTFLFLLLGLFSLWAGTELLLRGVLKIIDHYGLSHVFAGLFFLSIITDLPETAIALASSVKNLQGIETSGMIVGNAIGSSVAQISVILGISGLYGYFTLTKSQLFQDGAFLLGSVALLFLTALDGRLITEEGIMLLIVYGLYYWTLMRREKLTAKLQEKGIDKPWSVFFYVVSGIVVLFTGSELAVRNGLALAENWGISQSFIGIVIMGISTSLPELAVSISAAFKKTPGLSIGNIVGSNIYDVLVPVGLGATISPLSFESHIIYIDVSFLFLVSFLALFFFNKRKGLQKKEAIALIALFLLFNLYKVINPL